LPSSCGQLANGYGPFDYRTQRDRLAIVEQYHFKPYHEALMRLAGTGKSALGGDLDYTLRASPNHHRALIAMMRYAEREKAQRVSGAGYTIDCYFDRAVRFAPDDAIVRMIFAGFLGRQNSAAMAEKQVEVAAQLAGENPFTLYNVGIVYFELQLYDKALEFDHRAKALGWPRKDLEGLLREAGKWADPPAAAAGGGASAPSRASADPAGSDALDVPADSQGGREAPAASSSAAGTGSIRR
jgi:tetratricopeptide (TPR) repeat protein